MTTTTQTVRDIAIGNPGAVRVFEKYGIDYCCGGRVPLADACTAKNLNVDDVIASLEGAVAPSSPGEKDWAKESLASLAAYIVDTHHAYVNREIPRLNELASKVVSRHGDTRQELAIIQSKLAELGEEMITHQGKEEVVLFPYIGKFERAGSLISEIRSLSQGYTPPADACPTFRAF